MQRYAGPRVSLRSLTNETEMYDQQSQAFPPTSPFRDRLRKTLRLNRDQDSPPADSTEVQGEISYSELLSRRGMELDESRCRIEEESKTLKYLQHTAWLVSGRMFPCLRPLQLHLLSCRTQCRRCGSQTTRVGAVVCVSYALTI